MLEDRILIWKAKRGDRQAFEAIYRKYLDHLLTVAVHLLRDPGLAQDAVQEVFVKLIESLDTFELRGSLKSFLSCCVANRCRDMLRQRVRRPSVALNEHVAADGSPPPLALLIRDEQDLKLLEGLAGLPEEQREAIVLRHHGGIRFRKIAEAQVATTKTVQSRYHYGMTKLRTLLNGEGSNHE